MPPNPRARYRALHAAIQGGLVQAAHDLSEGGLAVAVAEMCIGGRLGAQVELDPLLPSAGMAAGAGPDTAASTAAGAAAAAEVVTDAVTEADRGGGLTVVEALFAESNGRLLVEVAEADAAAFEGALAETWCAHIGTVQEAAELTLTAPSGGERKTVLAVAVKELVAAWKGEVA